MSSISTLLPSSATTGTAGAATTNSFNSLTPADFVNMMVTQLQNQDPLDPTNSQDLLAEMSQIGQLQSTTQLQSTLTGLTLQNQIGSASSLIGKQIQGTDANNNTQSGVVTSVTVVPPNTATGGTSTGSVSLNLNSGATVPLGNVTAITNAPTTAATSSTTTGTAPTTNTNASTTSAAATATQSALSAATTTATANAAAAFASTALASV